MLFTCFVTGLTIVEGAHLGGVAKEFLRCPEATEVMDIVKERSLISQEGNSLSMLDSKLLTTFLESCHKKISLYHLPLGEKRITLDDVCYLFHLPLACNFFNAPIIIQQLEHITIEQNLGVTEEQLIKEFMVNRGAHFRLSKI